MRLTLALSLWVCVQCSISHAQEQPKSTTPKAPVVQKGDPKKASSKESGSQLNIPPPEVLLLLVRTSLIALDQANKTNNYTVFRELGGPGLQVNSSAKLGEIFAPLRNQKIDLSPVALITPQVVEPPRIEADGTLVIVGHFPTQPLTIVFQTVFQVSEGHWRLHGMNVSMPPAKAPDAKPPR